MPRILVNSRYSEKVSGLLGKAATTRQPAQQLNPSVDAIEIPRENIKHKLRLNTNELIRRAVKGWPEEA
jgi:hypothetical protein